MRALLILKRARRAVSFSECPKVRTVPGEPNLLGGENAAFVRSDGNSF